MTDQHCTAAASDAGASGCIVWSAHCYLDRDNSGTHFNWTAEVQAGVTVNTGVDRLKDFAAWLTKYNFKRAHIGEMGAQPITTTSFFYLYILHIYIKNRGH